MRPQAAAQSIFKRVGDPLGFLLLQTLKLNSGLLTNSPTYGFVVGTIKTNNIGTLTC